MKICDISKKKQGLFFGPPERSARSECKGQILVGITASTDGGLTVMRREKPSFKISEKM